MKTLKKRKISIIVIVLFSIVSTILWIMNIVQGDEFYTKIYDKYAIKSSDSSIKALDI